jgi:hypothetical protein
MADDNDNVIPLKRGHTISDSPEGKRLQQRILDAVRAYRDFLDTPHIWPDNPGPPSRLKAMSVVVEVDFAKDPAGEMTIHYEGWGAPRRPTNPDLSGPDAET